MKPRFRFKLRTLLFLIGVLSVLGAIGSGFLSSRFSQKSNVQRLLKISDQSDGLLFSITVWYDNDLRWNENEKRHQLGFDDVAGFRKWICETAGKDFAFCPISIEIDCEEFDDSTLSQELIEQIRRLPTIEQVWVEEWSNDEGGATEATTKALKKIFPDLIIASSQESPCHEVQQPIEG